MFTRAEIRLLRQTLAPRMESEQTQTTTTEAVVLTGPVEVYAIAISNLGGVTQTYDFFDGTNAPANSKIFFGAVAGNDELSMSWAPGRVRFDTEVRLVTGAANTAEYSIFYRKV